MSFLLVAALSIAWQIPQGRADQATITAEEPFEAVGLSWSSGSNVSVRVRVSTDRVDWSDWMALEIDGDLTDATEGRYVSAITHFGSAKRYIEYSFDEPVDRVTLTLFPPATPHRERLTTNALTYGSLEIRSRVDWACPDGEGSPRWTPAYTTVTHAVVHHTAGSNSLPDWETEVRNIWYYHTFSNAWGDIGYNFLIDPNGVIYEGRAGGAGAIGAHFSCRNSNTVGIALLGTFMTERPTDAALSILKSLLAEIIAKNSIDPTAIVRHPSSGLDLPTILGHRDGNVPGATCTITVCPGDVVYAILPLLRSELVYRPPTVRRRAVHH
ncbi:MAG TPA: N-acetylmuramoyl-L-alanine amidase [Thermoanaerobaculia bacterium]